MWVCFCVSVCNLRLWQAAQCCNTPIASAFKSSKLALANRWGNKGFLLLAVDRCYCYTCCCCLGGATGAFMASCYSTGVRLWQTGVLDPYIKITPWLSCMFLLLYLLFLLLLPLSLLLLLFWAIATVGDTDRAESTLGYSFTHQKYIIL